MKGLLLKDLYMSRKTVGIYLLMIAIFAICQGDTGVIFTLFYAIVIPINLIAADERDCFDHLLPMLPVRGVTAVLDKYIVSWCMMLVVPLVYAIRCQFPGAVFNPSVLLIGMSVALISQAISLPLIFHFGVERGRMIYLIAIALQAAALGVLGALWGDVLAFAMPRVIVSLALCIGVALSVGSIFVSSRAYEKRCTV